MKKARKPYVCEKTKDGKRRLYYRIVWHEGGRRRERFIPLPSDEDSAEFDLAYWAIRSGKAEAVQKPVRQTWAELVTAYKAHPYYLKKAEGTRRYYSRTLDDIVEKNGKQAVASLTRAKVREIHAKYADTPRKADGMIQVISLLCNFARLTLDWPVTNPAEGIKLYGTQREFEPWPDWMINALPSAHPDVQTAAELILGTGQRPGAAIAMRFADFHGEWMSVLDEKTNTRMDVYCPPRLRAFIAGRSKSGAHVLAKNLTQPLGYNSIEARFRKWRAGLGETAAAFSLHGLRKLSIIQLAEAGCSDAEIQAVTNQSGAMVAYYRKKASKRHLSRAAQNRREQNRGDT
ncbi:tyrosine-type recombinase/integrase [Xinfangfangia pollutisoli]|uniref:tyrosine-type recombinase/integrase n=1 Tax=Xinfangfangia pollutisoli TaxID=2865960 RepID=UPI001CD5EE00|nr:integrase [Xinfangfangia pollutisoli]